MPSQNLVKLLLLLMKQQVTRKSQQSENFGCQVHVPNSKKGIFLGFAPYTTRNILWYDVSTSRVKIATHTWFDEGMIDLPIDAILQNIQYLQRDEAGLPIETDDKSIGVDDFCFHITLFVKLVHKSILWFQFD